MLTLVVENQSHGTFADLRGKLVRRLAHDAPSYSRVGASGKPGAVQDAYKQLQEQVELLQAGIGKTALEQRILNEQQKIGSAASPEVVAALVRQQHALEQLKDGIEDMRSSFVGAFSDILTGAKSVKDAITDMLKSIAANAIRNVGNTLFDSAMGAIMGSFGGAGRVVGNDALSNALRAAIPGYANGVTDFAGGLAMVGERGRELVNLPRGSNVITNENTNKLLNGKSEQKLEVHIHENAVDGNSQVNQSQGRLDIMMRKQMQSIVNQGYLDNAMMQRFGTRPKSI